MPQYYQSLVIRKVPKFYYQFQYDWFRQQTKYDSNFDSERILRLLFGLLCNIGHQNLVLLVGFVLATKQINTHYTHTFIIYKRLLHLRKVCELLHVRFVAMHRWPLWLVRLMEPESIYTKLASTIPFKIVRSVVNRKTPSKVTTQVGNS